jgi:uncharacterized protein (DUF302 family)
MLGVLLMTSNIVAGAEGSTAETPSGQVPGKISTKTVRVLHRSIAYQADFGRFTESLERILGHKPPDVGEQFAGQPRLAEDRLRAAEGAQELMIFTVLNHGAALNMITAPRNAKQYLIGNPLTAIQMDQHDIRAALYAPLRVLVYEPTKGRTIVEYDQPSSLFGQFDRADVTQVARTLDVKLERVLAQAAALSQPSALSMEQSR